MAISKSARRQRIRYRIRKVVNGSSERPRLSVFRSNTEIYVQLINDNDGTTICAASSSEKEIQKIKGNRIERASAVGKAIAQRATEKGISDVAFDRGGNLYHGRVKALAEGAREGGLKF